MILMAHAAMLTTLANSTYQAKQAKRNANIEQRANLAELPVIELHQDKPHSIQIPMPLVRFVELIADTFHRIVHLKTKKWGQSVSTVWEKRILLSKFLLSTVAATALGSASSAATFEIMPDYPDAMVITGEIKEGDGVNFIRALISSPTPIKILRLNSPGGEMVAGGVIAGMTRTMMLNTLVGNNDMCASMCVLIFAAGIKRMHFSTGSIGVHSLGSYYPNVNRSFEDDSAKADNTNIAREFKRYGTPTVS